MDNTMNVDHITLADTGIPGGGALDKLGSGLKNLRKKALNNAWAKKAQKVSKAGQYWSLSSSDKKRIDIPQYVLDQVGGQGITVEMVESMPAMKSTPTIAQIKANAEGKALTSVGAGGVIGGEDEPIPAAGEKSMTMDYKKYIPYVLGVILIGAVIYAISHQAK